MKLVEIQTREKVPTYGPGEASLRLRSEPGPAPHMGWSLEYEAGIVTATRGDTEMLIPIGNIAFMRRAPTPPAESRRVKAA